MHPETPPGGMPITQLVPASRLEHMRTYMQEFAARFGVHDMRTSERIPNTRRALAVAEFAREQGHLEPFREAAMDAWWRDGQDIEADDVLDAVAVRAGLEPGSARAAAADPEYLGRVDALRAEANAAGVNGIPTFLIGESRMVGCLPYEQLEAWARSAGAKRR